MIDESKLGQMSFFPFNACMHTSLANIDVRTCDVTPVRMDGLGLIVCVVNILTRATHYQPSLFN